MSVVNPNRRVVLGIWLIVCCALPGMALVNVSGKYLTGLVLLVIITFIFSFCSAISKIALSFLYVSFPVTLQVMGKDALTTGTLTICGLFAWVWVASLGRSKGNQSTDKLFWVVYVLVLIAVYGTITETPAMHLGRGIRHLVNFVASVMLFLVIVNAVKIPGIAKDSLNYIDKVLGIIFFVVLCQICVGLLVYVDPSAHDFFSILFRRGQTQLATHVGIWGATYRTAGIVMGPEEMGEVIALLLPFLLYKAFVSGRIYFIIIAVFLLGLFLTGTRSAFMLIMLNVPAVLLFGRSKLYQFRKCEVMASIGLCVLALGAFVPGIFHPMIERSSGTVQMLQQGDEMVAVINRRHAWTPALAVIPETLSLFGHGPIQPIRLGMIEYNIHSLYLTLIFQYGVVGFFLFVWFFACIFGRLYVGLRTLDRNSIDRLFVFVCLISFATFLINEIKFEFNRWDSYQQIMWAVMGVYYLAGKELLEGEVVETDQSEFVVGSIGAK